VSATPDSGRKTPSFLRSIRTGDGSGLVLRNRRTNARIAGTLLPAFDPASRRTGLLGRNSLEAGTAMIIAPTNAIHTCFMRFAIDVAFVRRDGTIVKIANHMRPWRFAAAWSGFAVIEMAAGGLEQSETRVGDIVSIEPA
jgi:uncharacterized membrane protein (UPF0127 family)